MIVNEGASRSESGHTQMGASWSEDGCTQPRTDEGEQGASRSKSRDAWIRGLAEREQVCTTKSQQDQVLANVNEGGSRSESRYTQMGEQEWVCTTKSQQDRVPANANEEGSESKIGYTQMREQAEQEQMHTT